LSGGNYFGQTVSKCARIRALAHGGQSLMSMSTFSLVQDGLPEGVALRDLGTHALKDFQRSEHVWQLVHPDLPDNFPPLRSAEARAVNLPVQLTSFVGRKREIDDVKRMLETSRLVTLTGPGGCGKTRLAVEVGKQLLGQFEDGVHLVALATLSDPAFVLPTVAQSVGLQESAGEDPFEGLVNFLRDKNILLMLDNFEAVVSAGSFITDLLAECPDIKVLVTTRASLRLQGEREYQVPPLEVPELDYLPDLEHLEQHESIRLFVERAQAVKAGFKLTQSNARIVAEICHRLDGLPLAIELAAVRIKLLPPAVLLDRLSSSLALLTAGPRDLPARQQTLRSALDWDYTLLDPEEQKLFRRLAVCGSGFDLEAAQTIAIAAGPLELDLFDGIESLVNKSLLRQLRSTDEEPRFAMLQTIREYANDVLGESGEKDATRAAHAHFYLAVAEAADAQLKGPKQVEWVDRLEFEHDNLRSALAWAVENDEPEIELRLAGSLALFWSYRGYLSEGRRSIEDALKRSSGQRTPARARALSGAALLARARVDYDAARPLLEECLELERELGNRDGEASALKNLGNLELDQGRVDTGREFYEQSLTIWKDIGDTEGIAQTLNNLGFIAQVAGDQKRASTLLEEALALFRRLHDKQGVARALMNLGVTRRQLGDHARAATLARESLMLWRQLGDKWDVADCLEDLAAVVALLGQPTASATLYGGAEALRWAIGAPRPPVEQESYEARVEELHEGLGGVAFADAWGRGSAMRMEEIIDFALQAHEKGQ
ncbi:MAG: tetratricopeptide repeat protein, partial [Actinomycetota bacterium]